MAAPASAAAASVLDADTARAFGALLARFSAQRAAAALHARSVAAAAAPAPGVPPPPPPPPQASLATGTAPASASVPAPPPPLLDWSRVRPPVLGGKVLDYESLEAVPPDEPLHQELLRKVAIVKLNGGLGSSMGLQGPKGALPVRGPATFLDMTVRQVEFLNARFGVDVPLVLMNSFRTHESTVKVLRKYASHNVSVTCFVQGCFPRLDPDTLLPLPGLPYSGSPDDSGFYPPGHGDVFRALDRSGVLDALLARSVEYVFISNVDNLGATADLRLIQHLVNNEVEFAMEVADRTRGDVQGGVLVEYVSGGGGGGGGGASAAAGAAAVAATAGGGAGAGSGGAGAAGAAGAADAPTSVVKLVELAQVPPERLADFSRLRPFSCACGCRAARSQPALSAPRTRPAPQSCARIPRRPLTSLSRFPRAPSPFRLSARPPACPLVRSQAQSSTRTTFGSTSRPSRRSCRRTRSSRPFS